MIGSLALFALFVIAGTTSFQFYRGRKINLELMIDFTRELERALNPIDKTYTLLGMYSGFRAEFQLQGRPSKVLASVGLMPRESLWYYPISLLTLKHDRLYLLYYLDNRKIPKLHLLQEKVLSYKGIDIDMNNLKQIHINGVKYLYYTTDKDALKKAIEIAKVGDVLHVALTPETGVLYIFAKPKRGKVEKLARLGLKWAKELIGSGRV